MLTTFSEPTFLDILRDECRFRPIGPGKASLAKKYAEAMDHANRRMWELQIFLEHLGIRTNWRFADSVAGSDVMASEDAKEELVRMHEEFLEQATAQFAFDLSKGANTYRVGTMEWFAKDVCRFSFYVDSVSRSLMERTTSRMRHTHDLVRARKVRLPARSVNKPAECRRIIKAMPDFLHRWAYIVTGERIARKSEEAERRIDPTLLAKTVETVVSTGKAAATATFAAADAFGKRVQEVVSDPALVLGDYVLTGWE
ncbi:hypothetical protein Pan258_01630 [Symmachiella dynata]|uniref:hypothetical protein n=1 Tax=Symmachiella dynata TaxID=2527995 RepID=UPI001187FA3D|nr:hypothetical protein [Symmachiella dynata]QDT46146.1 hypothetical protein Pan258_01630 [Symmachiella dynata]